MPETNNAMPSEVAVAILARAPIPGRTKTRLIPTIGARAAAHLQRWLLDRTINTALAADVGPVVLWYVGDLDHLDVDRYRGFGLIDVRRQPDGDLGLRMLTAVDQSQTSAGAIVIGTDCPALGVEHLRRSAASLRAHDAVVIPAEDGGYVLIGMRAPSHKLFSGVDWGTEEVMAQTRERLSRLGWQWDEPARLWDVDRPEDLVRLVTMFPEARDAMR